MSSGVIKYPSLVHDGSHPCDTKIARKSIRKKNPKSVERESSLPVTTKVHLLVLVGVIDVLRVDFMSGECPLVGD